MHLAVDDGHGPGERRGLVQLPRINPFITIDLEIAKGVAGCVVCDRPIAKDMTRLKITVDMTGMPQKPKDHSVESYYVHPACITDRIKPEVPRMGTDCYDCGAPAPEPVGGFSARHPHDCFTVSKFALAKLCERCAQKPKWRPCTWCQVLHPQHLIETYVSNIWDFEANADVATKPMAVEVEGCAACAKRIGAMSMTEWNATKSQEAADRVELAREFEEARRDVIERYGGGQAEG